MMDGAFYFGCWREAGHYLFCPSGRQASYRLPDDFPISRGDILDAGFLPANLPEVEGLASFCHLNGWTIISFWDRSVDKRGKSNSSFLLRGEYSFDVACKAAAEVFPAIWSRFKFPIVMRGAK